jgi:hypothetical protein
LNLEIDPATSDATAKQNGLTVLERVRALRTDFGLSMTEAKAVIDATDAKPPLFPRVSDGKELTAALASELGYCGCASSAAVEVLRQFLRLVQRRTDACENAAEFALASRELESLLAGGGGWAEWLVYMLDQKDFVQHGFRQTDVLVSEKGRLLLAAIEQFEPE